MNCLFRNKIVIFFKGLFYIFIYFPFPKLYMHLCISVPGKYISLYKTTKANKTYKKSHSPEIEKFYFLLGYRRMLFKTIYSPKQVGTFPDHLRFDTIKVKKRARQTNNLKTDLSLNLT